MTINKVIRERRKELGLTQERVADYLGISDAAGGLNDPSDEI